MANEFRNDGMRVPVPSGTTIQKGMQVPKPVVPDTYGMHVPKAPLPAQPTATPAPVSPANQGVGSTKKP